MNVVQVTNDGRVIATQGGVKLDLWASLEPDERLRVATYLISMTRISGAINKSTLQKFEEKAQHRLKSIEEFRAITNAR